jgi:hypothetical protein
MSLVDADRPYRDSVENLATSLAASIANVADVNKRSFGGTHVTEAILARMGAFYDAQLAIKSWLGKRYVGAGADFFVETVLFFLKAYIERLPDLEVASERAVARKRGAPRPDITVWRGEECVAFAECKTQLGWNRHGWRADFEERERRIRSYHPRAAGYLVVMTALNWAGFDADDPDVGKRFFVLSRVWPRRADQEFVRENIETPLESMFRGIEKRVSPAR